MPFCISNMWGGIGGGAVHLLLNLLFFGGLVAVLGLGAVWVLARSGDQRGQVSAVTNPLEVARRRLAEGKITPAEFDEIRSQLS